MARASARPPRRLTDLAVIAPLLGLVLLVPPVIGLFAEGETVFGAPRILVYLFGIWAGLIIAAALLSRSLKRSDINEPGDP